LNEGNITIEEFGRVMKKSGQNPSEAELAQIIREVDLDGDGTINFDGISPLHFFPFHFSQTFDVKLTPPKNSSQ